MLTGPQKAKLLLAILGDKSSAVLSHLSSQSASLLTSAEEVPQEEALINQLMSEVLSQVNPVHNTPSSDPALSGGLQDDSLVMSGNAGGLESSSGFGLNESMFGDTSAEQVSQSAPSNVQREPKEIADLLVEEKPQIAAFVLSNIDARLREDIMSYLPQTYKRQIQGVDVDAIPMSEAVFQVLKDRLFNPDSKSNVARIRQDKERATANVEDPIDAFGGGFDGFSETAPVSEPMPTPIPEVKDVPADIPNPSGVLDDYSDAALDPVIQQSSMSQDTADAAMKAADEFDFSDDLDLGDELDFLADEP